MPPLAVDGPETISDHDALQEHPVGVLFFGDAPMIRVGHLAEEIEGAAHIQLLARLHVQQRQVDGAAPAVTGKLGDITLDKQLLLFQLREK